MINRIQGDLIRELTALATKHRQRIILATPTGIIEGTPYREPNRSLGREVIQFKDLQAAAFNKNAETCEGNGVLFLEKVKITMGDTVKYCEGMLVFYEQIVGISVGDFKEKP